MPDLEIVQYNTHLFGGSNAKWIDLFKKVLYQDEARRDGIIQRLREADADIVALNEVWASEWKERIGRRLADIYPHCWYPELAETLSDSKEHEAREETEAGGHIKFIGSGLLLLSKHRIDLPLFEEFNELTGEDAYARKGFITARVMVPDGPRHYRVHFVVMTHIQSPGKGTEEARLSNLGQMVEAIRGLAYGTNPLLLVGDLNITGDEAESTSLYQKLLRAFGIFKMVDLFREVLPDPAVPGYTYDATNNRLVQVFSKGSKSRKRLDYGFGKFPAGTRWQAEIPTGWKYKDTKSGDAMDLSDHYPLVLTATED